MNQDEIQSLRNDGVVVDTHGEKIGKVGEVYLDDSTGEPSWVTVKTGLFGTSESFVPLQGASTHGGEVRVSYTKDQVKDAPRVDADGNISHQEERELFAYYDMSGSNDVSDSTDRTAGLNGVDTDSREGSDMVRSEEQVEVGTERVATDTARLRKYVVTENVTTTVPVEREEVRIEREPIAEGERGTVADGDLGADEQEVTLTEDRVVVDKETVPVEKVRMDTEAVTEDRQVTEEVRKEQIDADLPDADTHDGHHGR